MANFECERCGKLYMNLKTPREIELEARVKELEQYKASKQVSYEHFQKKCNELELENRKLRAENDQFREWEGKVVDQLTEVLFPEKWIKI